MKNYLVSARKYRPATFKSVVGQKALTATLKNSIATDRLAHAYLFCGSRGVGKTSCARIFAKTINCQHRTPEGDACNECDSCRAFNEGRSLNIVELDAASNNSVDDIRGLVEQVLVPPTQGRYRVFIVDEVHMLSTQAFNAFLKTLEEPPAYVIFILATTEKHKIIPTILSRCQIYDFNRISIQDMVDHLSYVASQEGVEVESTALNVIARKADGAMRDALSIFDQVAASSMGNITYRSTIDSLNILDYEYYSKLVDAFLSENVAQTLLIYKEIRDKGFDSHFFINGLASHFRDLMVARDPATIGLLEATDQVRATMSEEAQRCTPDFLYKAMDLCNTADLNFRVATNKQFLIELTLIQLCQLLSPSPNKGGNGEGQLRPIAPSSTSATTSSVNNNVTAQSSTDLRIKEPKPISVQKTVSTSTITTKPVVSVKPGNISTPGLSLKYGIQKSSEKPIESQTERVQRRTSAFTTEDLIKSWNDFIDAHPTEHLLINAMRIAKPERSEGNRFVLTVESEAIRDSLNPALPDLHKYLRNKMLNDSITLEVVLNKGLTSVTSMTDSEAFAIMREHNPYINELVDKLKLTLS